MLRFFIHYGIHFIVPFAIGFLFLKQYRTKSILILLSAIVIDVDHLLAYPDFFDPNRCSIDFHPLHSYVAIGIYTLLLLPKKTRIFGIALLIHIVADLVDCYLIGTQFK